MKIQIHPETLDSLKEAAPEGTDIEQLINSILFLYSKSGFIRKTDIAGMVTIQKIFRKRSAEMVEVFDEATKDFKGVVTVGHTDSESLWIPNEKLHDLLEEHQVVFVMKSPRTKGISIENVSEKYIKVSPDEFF